MLTYPIQIEPDGEGYLVTCPDFPEVTTDCDSLAEAPIRAKDAIEEAIAGRLTRFTQIPLPSKGDTLAAPISLQLELKVLLLCRLLEGGETIAGLATRLGWHQRAVDRLFDPNHMSQLDQMDAALQALGAHFLVYCRTERAGGPDEYHCAPGSPVLDHSLDRGAA